MGPTAVRFYIDGDLVHTATTVGGTMRPIASDLDTGGGALEIDWMRMTPYASPGTFLSRVHDAGNTAEWGALSYLADVPSGTTLALSVRTGPTPVPDGGWSAFAPVTSGDDVPTGGRYLQYRAQATSASGAVTPTLSSVTLPFTAEPDLTDPTITARSPAPGATDVAIGTDVTVTFSEAVVPPTDWASAVTLRAEGSGTDVPAVVTANGAVVTLDPSGDLTPSTEYTVTVDGSVADAAGNALGADDTWSFTTSAPLSFVVDDTAADFGAGSVAGTLSRVTGDGEVTLAPTVGAEFQGAGLPAGWTSTLWAGGPGGSTVGGGAVAVNGALLATDGTYAPGRSLEFVATFGAETFQHVGFAVDFNLVTRWAMFSTNNSSTTLFVRTHNGSTAANIPLAGSLIGSPHRYRIDWSSGQVVFSVDGVVVHTETVAITGEMRPVASDAFTGGAPGQCGLAADGAVRALRDVHLTCAGCRRAGRLADAGCHRHDPGGHGDQLRGAHRRHRPTPTTGRGRRSRRWSMARRRRHVAVRPVPSDAEHDRSRFDPRGRDGSPSATSQRRPAPPSSAEPGPSSRATPARWSCRSRYGSRHRPGRR